MGSVLSIISLALCCTCTGISCACSFVGCCLKSASSGAGGISSRTARFIYLLDLFLVTLFALALRYTADDLAWDIAGYEIGCSNSTVQVNLDLTQTTDGIYVHCNGDGAVYRVSAATACFFALHLFFTCFSTSFHRGFWFWKLLIQIALIIGFFFIDQDMFNEHGFIWTARVFSVLFLLLQVILLIGFSFDWNDRWVSNSEIENAGSSIWLYMIVTCVILLYVGTFSGIVLLYMNFSCSTSKAVTTVTLIAVLILTGLTLMREKITGEPGAALPAAVISAYITYLAWAALVSHPDLSCKPNSLSSTDGVIGVGAVIFALSLAWGANQSSESARSIMQGSKSVAEPSEVHNDQSAAGLYEVGDGKTAADVRREQGLERAPKTKENNSNEALIVWIFHFIMVITTLYLSMVLTNWGSPTSRSEGQGQMWIRIGAQWVTILLYLWTIIAPAILTSRDFSTTSTTSHSSSREPMRNNQSLQMV